MGRTANERISKALQAVNCNQYRALPTEQLESLRDLGLVWLLGRGDGRGVYALTTKGIDWLNRHPFYGG